APPTAAMQKTPKIQPKPALYIPEQLQITEQFIASMTLLHHISVPHAWAEWCAAHQVTGINPRRGPQFDQFHSLIRAVTAGMGLALVPHCLVKDDIAAGLVTAPNLGGYQDAMGYYLCYPEARAHLTPLVSFKQWLLAAV
ncbi:MAG: hypothetical protein H7Z77_06985, partial [Chitinophagaceae bacterium]|nr:hypothetical protein [Polaromonas sp.]